MTVKLEETITGVFPTHDATGALADADSLPVGTLYKDGVDSGATVTITKIATGKYKYAFTISSGDGFAADDTASCFIDAVIGTINCGDTVFEDVVKAKDIDDDVTTDSASRTASKADVSALATTSQLTTVSGKVDTVQSGVTANGATATIIKKILKNRLAIDETNSKLIIYDDDGTTPLYQAALTDKDGQAVVLQGTGPVNRAALA